ncbi:PIG-L family deacetylase [Streptomyces sp. NRRL S-87]|uniref:PIG-L family deacetylase n=1 Tax=Streptomyces sp. NRRL S-87 TaxID=1463920 RepID=UPI0007C4528F|nr:PIG-L family deacetylase [Streptomyces sp. NRRL S-87]
MASARRIRSAVLVTVLLAGAVGAAAVVTGDEVTALDSPEPAAAPTRTIGGTVLQVVAHPDDDLFFMNPDLSRSLTTGSGLTTAYLTSGESDGVNAARGPHLKDPRPAPDRARYAEARQNGIRSAYAQMATGDRASSWRRAAVPTAGGGSAEVDTLVARPEVSLVWLQLREARTVSADRPDSLRGLWNGRIGGLESQLASGTPVTSPFVYTKDQLIRTISGVLERFKPTTIRIQDPTPGRFARSGKVTDHQDHVYGARFAQAAISRYAQFKDRPHFSVQNYLGYLNSSLPHVLDPATVNAKVRFLKTYAWLDRDPFCGSPAGCGDRKVAARPTGYNWAQSLRYTRGESTSWLAQGPGGGLYAFAVLDGRMALWHRTGPQGRWTGPDLFHALPGGDLDPGAWAVRLPDGRIGVFGTRTTLGERAEDYRRDVVYAVQRTAGGPFGYWQSLGTPEASDAAGTSAISGPAPVVLDGSGRLAVYVRDARRTLRAREQGPDGRWGPWQRLGGADLQNEPQTAEDSAGRRYVFGTTARTVLAWLQLVPGGPLTGPYRTGLPATTVPLTAVPEGKGVRILFRKPDSGAVRGVRVEATGTGPRISPVGELGAGSGYGAVGVAGTFLTGRAAAGTVAVAPRAVPPAWTESELLFAGAPAGTVEASGASTMAVLGLDAQLHWTTYPKGMGPGTGPAAHPGSRAGAGTGAGTAPGRGSGTGADLRRPQPWRLAVSEPEDAKEPRRMPGATSGGRPPQ